MPEVTIIGAGSWGTTLALLAHHSGARTTLVSSDPETVHTLRTIRRHPRVLPDLELPTKIEIRHTSEIHPSETVILALPSQHLRTWLAANPWLASCELIICAAKGIEAGTLHLPLQIIGQALQESGTPQLVALSGPNLAREIARNLPAATVVASTQPEAAARAQTLLGSANFRLYTSSDVMGVQLGGALKNVIAIAAGICDELGFGDNAKAALVTRGLAEITRLGVACGARERTFAGLSGLGDLIATCSNPGSRNHTVGRRLAAGESLNEILTTMHEVAEGVETTRAAAALAAHHQIDAPIINAMRQVLFENLHPYTAATELMRRTQTQE